jgi:hypothetical protein
MPEKTLTSEFPFGKLKILKSTPAYHDETGYHRATSLCLCECGNITEVIQKHLKSGNTRSCGCLQRSKASARLFKHGKSNKRSPIYSTWRGMMDRCYYPKHRWFSNYGGRGITVCERWKSFTNFWKDMGERPDGRCIERIDNNKGYEPGNCRWATRAEQNRNSRRNRILTVLGVTNCFTDLCAFFGIKRATVYKRLQRGMTVDRAFTDTTRSRRAKD